MSYTVKLPSGATLTMCSPGTSEGAETNPDAAHAVRYTGSHDAEGGGFNVPITRIGKRQIVARKRKQKTVRLKAFTMPSGKLFTPPEREL